MKEFIVENWKLLLIDFCVLLDLVSLIVCIVASKKKSGQGSPVYQVISRLPSIIIEVERMIGAGKGIEKKTTVLEVALDTYRRLTGINITKDSKIACLFSDAIEQILTAPQKKGVNND